MTLRSIVRDGLIVVNTHGEIPDGTPVVILRDDKPRRKVKKEAKTKRSTSKKLPGGLGGWKDRKDIGDSGEYIRRPREDQRVKPPPDLAIRYPEGAAVWRLRWSR